MIIVNLRYSKVSLDHPIKHSTFAHRSPPRLTLLWAFFISYPSCFSCYVLQVCIKTGINVKDLRLKIKEQKIY